MKFYTQTQLLPPSVDVISTAIASLTTLSKAQRRPAFGSIFLLNNIGYLIQYLVVSPRSSAVPALFAKPTIDALGSGFRTAKAAYFESNFSPLIQALADDTKDRGVIGTGKSSTKEKLVKFFDILEEITERHRMVNILQDDIDSREQVADEVLRVIVPSLQRFLQKQRDKSRCQKLLVVPAPWLIHFLLQIHKNVIFYRTYYFVC